jgi:hypothetical protein
MKVLKGIGWLLVAAGWAWATYVGFDRVLTVLAGAIVCWNCLTFAIEAITHESS